MYDVPRYADTDGDCLRCEINLLGKNNRLSQRSLITRLKHATKRIFPYNVLHKIVIASIIDFTDLKIRCHITAQRKVACRFSKTVLGIGSFKMYVE